MSQERKQYRQYGSEAVDHGDVSVTFEERKATSSSKHGGLNRSRTLKVGSPDKTRAGPSEEPSSFEMGMSRKDATISDLEEITNVHEQVIQLQSSFCHSKKSIDEHDVNLVGMNVLMAIVKKCHGVLK